MDSLIEHLNLCRNWTQKNESNNFQWSDIDIVATEANKYKTHWRINYSCF
jgi:hypothetical protein